MSHQAPAPVPTMPPLACLYHLREDACALNNLGVSMMLRGHFQSAATAFKDSISVLRVLVSEDPQAITATAASAKAKVHKLSIILSHITLTERTISLNVLDSNDWFALRSAFQDKSHFSAVFLRESSLAVGKIGVGIVLYNYGVVCALQVMQICRTSSEARQDEHIRLCTKAHKFLMLGYSALSTSFKTESAYLDGEQIQKRGYGTASDVEASLFSILAVSALSKLLWLQRDNVNSNKADQRVQEMIERMDAMNIWVLLGGGSLMSAVAA